MSFTFPGYFLKYLFSGLEESTVSKQNSFYPDLFFLELLLVPPCRSGVVIVIHFNILQTRGANQCGGYLSVRQVSSHKSTGEPDVHERSDGEHAGRDEGLWDHPETAGSHRRRENSRGGGRFRKKAYVMYMINIYSNNNFSRPGSSDCQVTFATLSTSDSTHFCPVSS